MTTIERPRLHLELVEISGRYAWQIEVAREFLYLKLKQKNWRGKLGYGDVQSLYVCHHGVLTQQLCDDLSEASARLWSAEMAGVPVMIDQLQALLPPGVKMVKR